MFLEIFRFLSPSFPALPICSGCIRGGGAHHPPRCLATKLQLHLRRGSLLPPSLQVGSTLVLHCIMNDSFAPCSMKVGCTSEIIQGTTGQLHCFGVQELQGSTSTHLGTTNFFQCLATVQQDGSCCSSPPAAATFEIFSFKICRLGGCGIHLRCVQNRVRTIVDRIQKKDDGAGCNPIL